MSLPQYNSLNDKKAYPEDIKEPSALVDSKSLPLEYDEKLDSSESPNFIQREFIFCNSTWSTDLLIFTSEDAAIKYKSFKNVSVDSENFKHVLNLQQQGFGMPLMEAIFKWTHTFANGTFATIYKFIPPLPDSSRLFDIKHDKYKFCTVYKKCVAHYARYTFTILPNPSKPSETFEFSIFFHKKLPIADVTLYDGSNQRYRWVQSKYSALLLNFIYSLYSLDEGQTSMIDNMDVKNYKLDKKNPLVYSTIRQLFKCESTKVKDEYLSLVKSGELVHFTDKISISSYQQTAKLLLNIRRSEKQIDIESVNSVELPELINLCMSIIVKRHEEIKVETTRAVVSSA